MKEADLFRQYAKEAMRWSSLPPARFAVQSYLVGESTRRRLQSGMRTSSWA